MGKTGPPKNDKNPDFIKDRDVFVLTDWMTVNAQSCEQLSDRIYHQKDIKNCDVVSAKDHKVFHSLHGFFPFQAY